MAGISLILQNNPTVTQINCGTSSSTQTDPFFSNVSLLLHMDGTDGSQTFIDSSKNNVTLTAFGTQIDTSIKKFGSSSAYFDGAEDFLTFSNKNLDFGIGDFTIEFWAYKTSGGTNGYVRLLNSYLSNGWGIELGEGADRTKWSSYQGEILKVPSIPQNEWVHVAFCRSNGVLRIFYNGVIKGSTTDNGNYIGTGNDAVLGQGDESFYYPGYLDELRITKGVARYTANFTPPTLPFPDDGKLGGTIDISAFPTLQDFRCNNNDITAIYGYAQNSNLRNIQFFNNKVTGSIPSLSDMSALYWFSCHTNQLTGPIPSLSANTGLALFSCHINELTGQLPSLNGLSNLEFFECFSNKLTGPIPSLTGSNKLKQFRCHTNQLTGTIPSLSGLSNLENFQCHNQTSATKLTGPIPSLSGLNNLNTFNCSINRLTGPIPSLSANTGLAFFSCASNLLTGTIPSLSGLNNLEFFSCWSNDLRNFAGGPVSNTLINFQAQNNLLTQSAVDAILAEFVAAGGFSGILNLGGGTNASPTQGESNPDKLTLESRDWSVTVTP